MSKVGLALDIEMVVECDRSSWMHPSKHRAFTFVVGLVVVLPSCKTNTCLFREDDFLHLYPLLTQHAHLQKSSQRAGNGIAIVQWVD